MADRRSSGTIVHQIAEHLRLEERFGGDWIPVQRRKPGKEEREETSPGPSPSTPGPGFRARASEPPPEARARKGKGLPRIQPPVRSMEPEVLSASRKALEDIAAEVARCRLCPLCEGRTNTVPGDGHPAPRVCFVGEGPGADEDATGIPFVGRAGKLLTRMIEAMGLRREEVFIMNTVKCRPPGNRTPETSEIRACWPYLEKQIDAVRPEIIVTLGRPATQTLLETDLPMGRLRGRFSSYGSIPVMPTYHPAYLLRNPAAKSDSWEDLKKVYRRLVEGTVEGEEPAEAGATPGGRKGPEQGSLFG